MPSMAELHSRDAPWLDRCFRALSPANLAALEQALGESGSVATARLVGEGLLRRKAHHYLVKASLSGDVDAGLRHALPPELQARCVARYGGPAPASWHDCIARLRELSGGSRERLWRSVVEHPMTEYVPNQCQHCGRPVPDETTPGNTDADVGLTEVPPTDEERLLVRSGYYRGPREVGAVGAVLVCVLSYPPPFSFVLTKPQERLE